MKKLLPSILGGKGGAALISTVTEPLSVTFEKPWRIEGNTPSMCIRSIPTIYQALGID